MAQQFQAGDVVRLKSGGPAMTVNSVGASFGGSIMVYCDWFEKTKRISEASEPAALELVKRS